ncbi:hypothetical protein MRB53_009144 [Persea americana]|uniref:Uncharacterized protein n=1 Tax=Persea americana TaxID=3435 RepID=A0ACC2LP74_PERAE|nr:hypothetical protein MRB53_009144 [Persea americana]
MVYTTYTPTYYSSLHDTITSLCKNVLPFSLKKKRLPALAAAEQILAKQQSENLKWQQESFHRILNLIGLQKEGILQESEVSAFRSELLETLIKSPVDQEQPTVIRDKLIFLQELFYANCISEDDYHSSKRPLLQRLAVQGAEINCKDVIVAGNENSEEEWSVIEFKDEQCLIDNDSMASSNTKAKNRTPMKHLKGAVTMIGITSPFGKSKGKTGTVNSAAEPLCPINPNRPSTSIYDSFKENPFWETPSKANGRENQSVLMAESSPPFPLKSAEKERGTEKVKKKAFRSLFQKEQSEGTGNGVEFGTETEEKVSKSAKKQWGFKKWKRSNLDEESTPYLPSGERSDDISPTPCVLVPSPIGEGPNTKLIKKKLHSDGSASDFFIDKVLGENIKKELSQIQTELSTTNPNLAFSNEQIDAISTRLPVDKADLKKFFPKSWCDRYGDVVLDVVKKEFKDHVGEMETLRNAAKERNSNSARWVAFEDNNDENSHPNLFFHNQYSSKQGGKTTPANILKEDCYYSSNSNCYANNPFHDSSENQNPFYNPRNSSMIG